MKINFERMDCMSVRENSLRIYDTKRTFFSKIGSTFSKIFEPTREGINNLIINSKRNNVLKYNHDDDLSLVKIDLKTGRHHQIRVQFSSRGHALYGDNKYHGRSNSNICLFAYQLSFVHPVTKEVMEFEEFPFKNGMWKMIDGI